jgi:hypothetical protein
MVNQDTWAGFATIFGSMLLAIAVTMACFLVRGAVPPFIVVVLPAIIGSALLTAGLLAKKDNGWSHHVPPERRD